MLKRIATLLLGIGLIGLGVLFFIAPERAFITQLLTRLWPLFLILAGLVRVAGYLIDRHPRSPVGGMMITAIGGVLLAANLRAEHSVIQLIGNYWFWLLLALIIGRVLRQYTHRNEEGPRPRTFSPGAVLLMILIVGGGLAANYFEKNRQQLNGLNLRIGEFGDLRDYVFGNQLSIEDEPPQTFALLPNSRLIINGMPGDIEIATAQQTEASARIIKRVRAVNEEEAKQAVKNIHLQVASQGAVYQIGVNSAGVQGDFSAAIIITVPQNVAAGVEIANCQGSVKLSGLRGDHLIRNVESAEVKDNTGRVTIENPRGSVELSRIRGEIGLINASGSVELREISGAINFDVKGSHASIEQVSGPVRGQVADARIELNGVGGDQGYGGPHPIVNLDDVRNSRVDLKEIKGAVAITARQTRIEAEDVSGDFAVNNSGERLIVHRVNGAIDIKSDNGAVEVEDAGGAATIEATLDVAVRNFRNALNVTSRYGAINLSTDQRVAAEIKASTEKGRIRLSLPEDSGFRIDAASNYGQVRLRGFEQITLQRAERSAARGYNLSDSSPLVSLRTNNGDIQVKSSGLALAKSDE